MEAGEEKKEMEIWKLRGLIHFFITVFLSSFAFCVVAPAITDVTMSALCPGRDQCSLAIYLSGFQQAIMGLGSLVMMPVLGNLSDKYGRKALLTIPVTLPIIPLAILAYSRDTPYFYAYFVLKTLTGLVSEGGIISLGHAYMADNIGEQRRAPAFGILSGVLSAALLSGTLTARFLSTAKTFQVATIASIIGAGYMRIFLKESVADTADDVERPILKADEDSPITKLPKFHSIPSVGGVLRLFQSSTTFAQAAVVAFFCSLDFGGLQASLLYFLKARFHYSQTQYADLMLILAVSMIISQLLLLPAMASIIREERLLSIGLLMGFVHVFVYSISWSAWVPYASATFGIFSAFTFPCLRSIVSKQVLPNAQGMAQGCISGVESFGQIISPLIFSPLTAWFLSEDAPFDYPGFSLLCVGFTMMIAFIVSTMIRPPSPAST